MNTLLACYQVGIYSDKQLVGEGESYISTLNVLQSANTYILAILLVRG